MIETQNKGDKMENTTVANFRDMTENCFDNLNSHWHSCVGEDEKVGWFIRAMRAVNRLSEATCKTAKPRDLERKENVMDRFSTHCNNNLPLWQKARIKMGFE